MTLEQLKRKMAEAESPRLEFKEARTTFAADDMLRYLCALSNEGGGHLVFGVTDRQPRRIVGTRAFLDFNAHIRNWQQSIGRFIQPFELFEESDLFGERLRVLVLLVEKRAPGGYVTYKGIPYVRHGESLTTMSPEQMRQCVMETVDMSAEVLPGTSLDDIDPDALAAFRAGVVAKTPTTEQKKRYEGIDPLSLLRTLGLSEPDGTLTRAALLLLGREEVIGRRMAQAEIIFERRSTPTAIRYEVRHAVRRPLLLGLDKLVETIMPYARLEPIEVQTGTRVVQRPRYPERSVREALLNAVAHRDYALGDSVRVDMSPEAFVVTSPGPFPADVTPENVAERSYWRNRLLAEALEKCGLIERSGQGVDLMMLAAVQRAQPLPLFEQPEHRHVRVSLFGRSDEGFLQFTRQVASETWDRLSVEDFRTLDAMRRQLPATSMEPESVQHLIDLDLVQRTTGGHLRPADRWLRALEETEQRRLGPEGLNDRIVEALRQNEPAGLSMKEIASRFPDQTRYQLRQLLNAMREERVELRGQRGGARWHAINA